MRKLCGAAAILLSCVCAALGRLRGKKEKILLLHALAESLLELRSELSERQRSLGECFRSLAQKNRGKTVGSFYGGLCGDLRGLGERRFSEIWRGEAERCFAQTGVTVLESLRPLGVLLGGSELDRQCEALERASRRIAEAAEAQRSALGDERRLCLGLSLSAGAFLVIMLM